MRLVEFLLLRMPNKSCFSSVGAVGDEYFE